MTTAATIIDQLAKNNDKGIVLTLDELRGLADSLSAATTNADGNGVLYSGLLADGTPAYQIAESSAKSIGYGELVRDTG